MNLERQIRKSCGIWGAYRCCRDHWHISFELMNKVKKTFSLKGNLNEPIRDFEWADNVSLIIRISQPFFMGDSCWQTTPEYTVKWAVLVSIIAFSLNQIVTLELEHKSRRLLGWQPWWSSLFSGLLLVFKCKSFLGWANIRIVRFVHL